VSEKGRKSTLVAYYPSRHFPSVSVTGSRCQLGCAHCGGHYLKGMLSAETPDELRNLAVDLDRKGCAGFLLSGGCDSQANVPLGPFAPAISDIKRNTGLQVSVHPGLIGEVEASDLVEAGVDVFCIDIVQDRCVIRDVLGLGVPLDAYDRTLAAIFDAGAKQVVPHITIGLAGDSDSGEMAAVDLVSRYGISSLALLSFIPTPGTRMSGAPIVSDEHFLRVVEYAVGKLDCPVTLGCMRTRGNPDLEVKCFEAGISGIAVPSRETMRRLGSAGVRIERKDVCCAFL
jgi:lipoyl synthase